MFQSVIRTLNISFYVRPRTVTWVRTFLFNIFCISNKMTYSCFSSLKVALQILGLKFFKNTKESSLFSQRLFNFIYRTPVVERHPITREIRDLLWPMSTPKGNTVYFYMSSSFIYTLNIHRGSFKHGFG